MLSKYKVLEHMFQGKRFDEDYSIDTYHMQVEMANFLEYRKIPKLTQVYEYGT